MAQVALKWVLQQPGVVAPIIGATKPSQLDELVQSFKVCSRLFAFFSYHFAVTIK